MEIIKRERRLCLICMEEHEVLIITQKDTEEFKKEEVTFEAKYEYCNRAEELLETEEMIKANSLAMKDAYRKKVGLLTSEEIVAIRQKYGVSQKDFSDILDWGRATIYRYENHQVQDRAHDDILRKIDADPKWFMQMLNRAEDKISNKAFNKYCKIAKEEFNNMRNQYIDDIICASYVDFESDVITGGVELNLNKVVEVINYFALEVEHLHKVKLMKMLWYADVLNYKKTGKSMMGLVYRALPMGAVPVEYEQIIQLDNVKYETIQYPSGDIGYKFYPSEGLEFNELTNSDIQVLNTLTSEVGNLNTEEIIKKMHSEDAYKETDLYDIIPYSYAEKLSIS